MKKLINTHRNAIAISISFVVLLLILLIFIFLQSIRVGGKDSLNNTLSYASFPTTEYGNSIKINGKSTGVIVNTDLDYSQESIPIDTLLQCSADTGFEKITFKELDNKLVNMYLVNREQITEDKFNDYYSKFNNKQYVNGDNQFIIYPFCGGANYINSFSYNYTEGRTPILVNVAVGGYQYVPTSKELINISVAAFAYNQKNLIQINFELSKSFKFEEIDGYLNCSNTDSGIVSYATQDNSLIYDLGCVADLIANRSDKLNLIKTNVDSVLKNIGLELE